MVHKNGARPVTSDQHFFGRSKLIQTIATRISTAGQSTGLFGLRKTGKTSVLFALQRRFEKTGTLCVYIDCQSPGVHGFRWWQLLEHISEMLVREATQQHNLDISLPQFDSSNAAAQFTSLLQRLTMSGPLDRVVVLLDEVEYITPELSGALGKHWDADFIPFWATIRATSQQTQGRFTFLIAGVNPAYVERPHFKDGVNPILQLAQPIFLEPLTDAAVRDMLRTIGKYSGLRFEEDVYRHLSNTYGGHPFLIRLAASEVFRSLDLSNPQKRATVTVRHFVRLKDKIRARLQIPLRDILLSLVWWYEEEYELLNMLASGSREDEAFVRDWLREYPGSAVQFARYGILQEDGSFAISGLKEFLQAHGGDYAKELSPYRRSDVSPSILPQLPDRSLLGRLFEKRTEVEVALRRVIVLTLSAKNGWDNKKLIENLTRALRGARDRKDPSQLFVGREVREVMEELYFLDLGNIVLFEFELYKPLFKSFIWGMRTYVARCQGCVIDVIFRGAGVCVRRS